MIFVLEDIVLNDLLPFPDCIAGYEYSSKGHLSLNIEPPFISK